MKERFKAAMRYLFPKGPVYASGNINKQQWRDLCKVFAMGWIEGLHSAGNPCPEEMGIVEKMVDFNWWPDDSWKWW